MSGKSVEAMIRELTKTVLSMESKIVSLENTVSEQNKLIKLLVRESEDTTAPVVPVKITEEVGKRTTLPAPRPMRSARARATSALTAAEPRKAAGASTSPALAGQSDVAVSDASSSHCARPSTRTPTMTQNDNDNTPTMNHAQPNGVNNNTDWVEVKRRRSRLGNVTRGTASPGSNICALSAAERKSYLHLYFVQIGTTDEQVISHLRNICPGDKCSAEALKSRGDYASFKLTVPTKNVELYLKSENWAEDVHVKPWRNGFRRPRQETSS